MARLGPPPARLAGRRDVSELGRQLARNEDKLEAVLALVEELQDDLKTARAENAALEAGAPTTRSTPRKSAVGQE